MFLIKLLYHHTKPDPGCRSDRSHCSDDHLKEKQYRKRPAIVRDKPGQCRDSKKVDLHIDELQREAFPENGYVYPFVICL